MGKKVYHCNFNREDALINFCVRDLFPPRGIRGFINEMKVPHEKKIQTWQGIDVFLRITKKHRSNTCFSPSVEDWCVLQAL